MTHSTFDAGPQAGPPPETDARTALAPLRLLAAAQALLVGHAQRQFPFEACGVLLGHDRLAAGAFVVQALPLPNARMGAHDASQCFAIAPADMARAYRHAREQGLQVLGFFHSHPLGDARPSAADVAGSPPWPGLTHVIVALDALGRPTLSAWAPQAANTVDATPPGWLPLALHTVIVRRRTTPSTVLTPES
jgi:proteasome lid subunit RPN8/RPN11